MGGMVHEDVEHSGRYVVSVVESAGQVSPVFRRKAEEILADYGIEPLDEERWYSSDAVANAIQTIADEVGQKTIEEVGVEMGQNVPWPEDIETPKQGLQALPEMHHSVQRNAPGDMGDEVGEYRYKELGDSRVRMAISSSYPYPVALSRGVYKGVVKSLGSGSVAVVVEETDANYGERTAHTVTW